MNASINWILTLKIKDGQLAALKEVRDALVSSTEQETGTITYEWYFNEDGTRCDIHERFVDSDAALIHMTGFSGLADRFFAAAEPVGLTIYGDPSDAVKEGMAGMNPVFLSHRAGFRR